MAQPGGVLTRAGHTEAGCDLARLAGLEPAAVIVEILNDDGAMARRDDLVKFARRHELKIGTIADLIEYRLRTEESVEIIGETEVETEFGPFRLVCFEDHVNRAVHLALVRGKLDAKTPTLVRVHRQDTLERRARRACARRLHRPLRDALKLIAEADHGVAVILRPEESARDLMRSVQSLTQPPEPERRRAARSRHGLPHVRHRRADRARTRRAGACASSARRSTCTRCRGSGSRSSSTSRTPPNGKTRHG